MDRNVFTVLFQPPFWVGIAERWEKEGYSAARVVFGAEPTDAQLYEWLEKEWHRLNFSPAEEGEQGRLGLALAVNKDHVAAQAAEVGRQVPEIAPLLPPEVGRGHQPLEGVFDRHRLGEGEGRP